MKNLNLLLYAAILCGFFSPCLKAQDSDSTRTRELFLSGNPLTFENFGLQYKKELNNGNFLRIGVTNISIYLSKNKPGFPEPVIPSVSSHYGGTFDIGIEKRNQITKKLICFYGLNFVFKGSLDRVKREDPSLPEDLRHLNDFQISPGFGFNSGFNYRISDAFSVSAELIPELFYTYSSSEGISGTEKVTNTIQGGSFSFNNQNVLVSLIYRWNK